MATAANVTFRGSVRPVGSQLPVNFKKAAALLDTSTDFRNYDCEIDEDYALTALEVTKTSANVTALTGLQIGVYKVGPGPIATATLTPIAAVTFIAAALVGTKLIAGVKSTDASVVVVQPYAETAVLAANYMFANATDPFIVPVLAETTAVGVSTKQKIRLQIKWTTSSAVSPDPSCFILASFCKLSRVELANSSELITVDADLAAGAQNH